MRKLVKKYQGGGIASPSSIGQLIQNRDLGIIRQQADLNLREGLQLPNNDSIIKQPKSFDMSKMGNVMNLVGGVASTLYNVVPTADKVVNSNDETMGNLRSTAFQGMVQSKNPWMKMAGVANMVIDKTGGFTDASEGLGKKTDTLNKIASVALPGAGWFTRRTDNYKMSDTLKQNEASYGGSVATGRTAEKNAGAKILFGKGKADSLIAEAKRQDRQINGIMDEAKDAFLSSNNSQTISLRNQMDLNGTNWNTTRIGKSGLKLDRDFAKRVVNLSNKEKEISKVSEVLEFKNGGTVNVIPDGALHKNKHHLENVDEKFEEVTAKGIPVITESAGGDITQHAEVEREEIIFNLDVTKQLEKLMEDGSDEAAIEAGKLLVHEILENTVDNTGLLNKIE